MYFIALFALGYFSIITLAMEIFFRSMCLGKFFMGKFIKDNSIKYLKEEGPKEGIYALALRKASSTPGSNKCEAISDRD